MVCWVFCYDSLIFATVCWCLLMCYKVTPPGAGWGDVLHGVTGFFWWTTWVILAIWAADIADAHCQWLAQANFRLQLALHPGKLHNQRIKKCLFISWRCTAFFVEQTWENCLLQVMLYGGPSWSAVLKSRQWRTTCLRHPTAIYWVDLYVSFVLFFLKNSIRVTDGTWWNHIRAKRNKMSSWTTDPLVDPPRDPGRLLGRIPHA